jgi:hypothetical protein
MSARWFARQKVKRAHAHAQWQQRIRCINEQEHLLVTSELRLVNPTNEKDRKAKLNANASVLAHINNAARALSDCPGLVSGVCIVVDQRDV